MAAAKARAELMLRGDGCNSVQQLRASFPQLPFLTGRQDFDTIIWYYGPSTPSPDQRMPRRKRHFCSKSTAAFQAFNLQIKPLIYRQALCDRLADSSTMVASSGVEDVQACRELSALSLEEGELSFFHVFEVCFKWAAAQLDLVVESMACSVPRQSRGLLACNGRRRPLQLNFRHAACSGRAC